MDFKKTYPTEGILTAQKVCQLIQSGKIAELPIVVPGEAYYRDTPAVSKAVGIYASTAPRCQAVQLDGNRVLLGVELKPFGGINYSVLVIENGQITQKPMYTIGTSVIQNLSLCVLNPNKVLVTFTVPNAVGYILTIGPNDVITIGNVVQLSGGEAIDLQTLRLPDLNKSIMLYRPTGSNTIYAATITVNGDTIVRETPNSISGGATVVAHKAIVLPDGTVKVFYKENIGNTLNYIHLSYSNGTWHGNRDITTIESDVVGVFQATTISDTQAVIAYSKTTDSSRLYGRLLYFLGDTVTVGTPTVLTSRSIDDIDCIALNSKEVYVGYTSGSLGLYTAIWELEFQNQDFAGIDIQGQTLQNLFDNTDTIQVESEAFVQLNRGPIKDLSNRTVTFFNFTSKSIVYGIRTPDGGVVQDVTVAPGDKTKMILSSPRIIWPVRGYFKDGWQTSNKAELKGFVLEGDWTNKNLPDLDGDKMVTKNLMDGIGIKLSDINSGTGVELPSNKRFLTDYVAVRPGVTYNVGCLHPTLNSLFVVEYDAIQQPIGRSGWTNQSSWTFTASVNTHFVRVLYRNASDSDLSAIGVFTYYLEKRLDLANVGTFFDGIKSVGSPDGYIHLLRTGKNKFDGQLEGGIYDFYTGVKSPKESYVRSSNYIPIKPNTRYITSSITGKEDNQILFYDNNKKFINFVNGSYQSFITPSNASYITFYIKDTNLNKQIQLEEGATITAFEPYRENPIDIYTGSPLMSLPSGIQDILAGKTLTRRVGTAVLDNTSTWTMQTKTLANTVLFSCSSITDFAIPTEQDSMDVWCNQTLGARVYATDQEGCFLSVGARLFYYRIAKSKLETPDLAGFQKYLQTHPIILHYPLEAAKVYDLPEVNPMGYINTSLEMKASSDRHRAPSIALLSAGNAVMCAPTVSANVRGYALTKSSLALQASGTQSLISGVKVPAEAMDAVALDDNRVAIAYASTLDNRNLYFDVFTVNPDGYVTGTGGTKVATVSTNRVHINKINSRRILITYTTGASNIPYGWLCNLNDAGVISSAGSRIQLIGQGTALFEVAVLDERHAIMFHHDQGKVIGMQLYDSNNINTMTTGVESELFYTEAASLTPLDGTRALLCYNHTQRGNQAYAVVLRFEETTPRVGTPIQLTSYNTASPTVAALNAKQAIAVYNKRAGAADAALIYRPLTIDFQTITAGAEVPTEEGGAYNIEAIPLDATHILSVYRGIPGNDKYPFARMASWREGVVEAGPGVQVSPLITNEVKAAKMITNRVAIISINAGLSPYLQGSQVTTSAYISNKPAGGKALGIVTEYRAGQGRVALSGLVKGFRDLSIGNKYYYDRDGIVSTNPTGTYIGVAISDTELYITDFIID